MMILYPNIMIKYSGIPRYPVTKDFALNVGVKTSKFLKMAMRQHMNNAPMEPFLPRGAV